MKIKIPNAEVQNLLSGKKIVYPKYVTQIINLANQNAQGTRAKVVGQMSELIQEFEGTALEEWEKWYLAGNPNAIENATEKIWPMVEGFKQSLEHINKDMIKQWVEELVIIKTFTGLKFQKAILIKVADKLGKNYRLATPEEESKGIDGFIEGTPISIKPSTYKVKMGLNERIHVPIIYYEKKKSDIVIEFNENEI